MTRIKYFIIILFTGLAWGCQTEPDSAELIDQMVVSTNFDPTADFTSYQTYAIPTDTIGFISNNSSDTIIVSPENTFPRTVLNVLKQEIDSRGYTRVDRTENPDLGINVMLANDFNVFQEVVYPDYYGYPGSYYSGYYGYGSYYSYPYINTYAYNTGVLIIEIVDLKNRTPDNKVKVIWDAYLGDVYSTINREKTSAEAIGQAFTQSPYIGK
jgi:hypothetical protein